jgi:Raf kinase inhibitor-like YbhB/YbcL family protein
MKKHFLFFILTLGFIMMAEGGFAMEITSPEFKNNTSIPQKFTCQGTDRSPTIEIKDAPANAKSLVLTVDDPDAPRGNWDHWIVYNILPQTTTIAEGTVPGLQCLNDFRRKEWGGPCPPSGTHRYFFKIYALDIMLPKLPDNARKNDLLNVMEGHIVDKAELVGLYKKSF